MKRVINFSGGKTSALMTILLKPTSDDIVLFCDTGREHPLTYKFIDDFEKFENIKVHKTIYIHDKSPNMSGFDALTNHKYLLPYRMKRYCTAELKVKTAKRYLRSLGIREFDNYIGFRYDDQKRIVAHKESFKKVKTFFPLNELKINKEMVNQYFLTKEYNLEIPSILGNCDLCFLKGKNVIINILKHYPELADKWIADEDKHPKSTYNEGISYRQLLHIAQSQKTLFDLQEQLPAYNCSCTS